MDKIGKRLTLFLALIIAMSSLILLTANPANAQSIPKPTVPEFTAKYVDRTYTVPATTTIDPYNGQKVTNPSYYVENRTLEIAIRNQPFTPYIDSSTGSPWQITTMYQIRTKGHFAQNWTNLYDVSNGFLPASNSTYTTVSYSLGEDLGWGRLLQANDQVDFQVEAMIGYVHRTIGFMSWYFTGESSDWSPTHTVTIPTSNVSYNPTVSPSPTPSVPELPWLILLPLFISTLTIAVLVRFRKNWRITQHYSLSHVTMYVLVGTHKPIWQTKLLFHMVADRSHPTEPLSPAIQTRGFAFSPSSFSLLLG